MRENSCSREPVTTSAASTPTVVTRTTATGKSRLDHSRGFEEQMIGSPQAVQLNSFKNEWAHGMRYASHAT